MSWCQKIFPISCRWIRCIVSILFSFSMVQAAQSAAFNLPELGEASAQDLPPHLERRIGELTMHDIERDADYIDDPDVRDYLQSLANKLTQPILSDRPDIELFVIRDPAVNAFAMPGGFIGLHTGLFTVAESESEVASVIAHEIGHVVQRHIARGVTQQKQDMLLYTAAMLAGLVAARNSGGQAVQAAIMGSQAAMAQSQLGFSRDAEREADRMGFSLLAAAGFDTHAMVNFFAKLQQTNKLNESAALAYVRTHPLTLERMSDMQNRLRDERYRQVLDSLDFQMVKARLKVLQENTQQGYLDALRYFEFGLQQLQADSARLPSVDSTSPFAARINVMHYGIAQAALLVKNYSLAQQALQAISPAISNHPMVIGLKIQLMQGQGHELVALELARTAVKKYPDRLALAYTLVNALQSHKQDIEAVNTLKILLNRWPQEAKFYALLAKSYAALGQVTDQSLAMANYYGLTSVWSAAVEQLQQAQRESKDFYQQSVIEARLRQARANALEDAALLKKLQ